MLALLTASVSATASSAPLEGEELRFGGIGDAYVGDSVDKVAAKLGVTLNPPRVLGTDCFSTSDVSGHLTLIHSSRSRVHLFILDSPDASFHQLASRPVRIGTSRDEVRQSFRGQEEVAVHMSSGREGDLTVEPLRLNNARRSANVSAVFRFDEHGHVRSVRLGDSRHVAALDGCRHSEVVPR